MKTLDTHITPLSDALDTMMECNEVSALLLYTTMDCKGVTALLVGTLMDWK